MKKYKFAVYRLRKLTVLLRILGFDVIYFQEYNYNVVIDLAKKDNRILLSRVKFLRKLPWILFLKEDDLEEQLKQIISRFKIKIGQISLFSRCSKCNSTLKYVREDKVKSKIPFDVCGKGYWFKKCQSCEKIFWNGNHMKTLKEKIEKLKILNI